MPNTVLSKSPFVKNDVTLHACSTVNLMIAIKGALSIHPLWLPYRLEVELPFMEHNRDCISDLPPCHYGHLIC